MTWFLCHRSNLQQLQFIMKQQFRRIKQSDLTTQTFVQCTPGPHESSYQIWAKERFKFCYFNSLLWSHSTTLEVLPHQMNGMTDKISRLSVDSALHFLDHSQWINYGGVQLTENHQQNCNFVKVQARHIVYSLNSKL